MPKMDLEGKKRDLELHLAEIRVRIRRYTLEQPAEAKDKDKDDGKLLLKAQEAWNEWLDVRAEFYDLPDDAPASRIRAVEHKLLQVDRKVDLIQRELVSAASFYSGIRTTLLLALVLFALAVTYLLTHGVHGLDISQFEPLAEWGPLKYVEVAYWSTFGVLCWLLFLSASYVSRRDFDSWYQPWYLATALRAPFISVIVMIVVLEFVEWYGEGGWIESYLLEEGNKFYFIVITSFCLGLMSDAASGILRDLAEGVTQFVRAVVQRFSKKLGSAIMPDKSFEK